LAKDYTFYHDFDPWRGWPKGVYFGKFCQKTGKVMSTMNISLPDALKSFIDDQVSQRGYSTSSEYVRELIRKDQDRQQLRSLVLAGAESARTVPVNGDYFESLRAKVRKG
jgi:antitoxin ParD1/3/4